MDWKSNLSQYKIISWCIRWLLQCYGEGVVGLWIALWTNFYPKSSFCVAPVYSTVHRRRSFSKCFLSEKKTDWTGSIYMNEPVTAYSLAYLIIIYTSEYEIITLFSFRFLITASECWYIWLTLLCMWHNDVSKLNCKKLYLSPSAFRLSSWIWQQCSIIYGHGS